VQATIPFVEYTVDLLLFHTSILDCDFCSIANYWM
jgi:hypothetical protein